MNETCQKVKFPTVQERVISREFVLFFAAVFCSWGSWRPFLMVQEPLAAEPMWSCPAASPALPIPLQVWFPEQTPDQNPPPSPNSSSCKCPYVTFTVPAGCRSSAGPIAAWPSPCLGFEELCWLLPPPSSACLWV